MPIDPGQQRMGSGSSRGRRMTNSFCESRGGMDGDRERSSPLRSECPPPKILGAAGGARWRRAAWVGRKAAR
eukprot:scaffold61585_cov89-Phaeocystis_antarctica.AAC.2